MTTKDSNSDKYNRNKNKIKQLIGQYYSTKLCLLQSQLFCIKVKIPPRSTGGGRKCRKQSRTVNVSEIPS